MVRYASERNAWQWGMRLCCMLLPELHPLASCLLAAAGQEIPLDKMISTVCSAQQANNIIVEENMIFENKIINQEVQCHGRRKAAKYIHNMAR